MDTDDLIILGMVLLIVGGLVALAGTIATILIFIPGKAIPFVLAIIGGSFSVGGYVIAKNNGAFG